MALVRLFFNFRRFHSLTEAPVYRLETRMLLRHYLDEGLTQAAIAERLGINERSMRRWIRAVKLDRALGAQVAMNAKRAALSKDRPLASADRKPTPRWRRNGTGAPLP